MATEPRGQRASACVRGRVRLALMCVDSWNSVGPLLSVSAQSGMKTETECGGRCCLAGVTRMLSRSECRGCGVRRSCYAAHGAKGAARRVGGGAPAREEVRRVHVPALWLGARVRDQHPRLLEVSLAAKQRPHRRRDARLLR